MRRLELWEKRVGGISLRRGKREEGIRAPWGGKGEREGRFTDFFAG